MKGANNNGEQRKAPGGKRGKGKMCVGMLHEFAFFAHWLRMAAQSLFFWTNIHVFKTGTLFKKVESR